MGSFCTPGQTTSTYTPNYQATQQYGDILNRANKVASTPYSPYGGQQVAGLTPEMTAGISGINAAAGTAQPYINTAANYAATGAAPVANLSSQDIQQYYNPYQKNVIDATMANISENDAQQQNRLKGNLAVSGALGGDRQSVLQSELARQQALASNQTLAGLQNQGFNTAASLATGQQANQQQNANRAGQAAYTFSGLGGQAQNAAISGGQAQIGAGQVAQGTNQAGLSAAYNNWLQQQAFPYQQASWLSGISNPAAQGLGGTQTTTPPAPSPFGMAAGLGMTALALAKDGGRVTGYASGGPVASPFNFIDDAPSFIPKAQLATPQQHNFGSIPSQVPQSQLPPISSLKGLKGLFGGSAGDFGGSPETNPNLVPFAHGGLVDTIHAIRHSIRSRYADGGWVQPTEQQMQSPGSTPWQVSPMTMQQQPQVSGMPQIPMTMQPPAGNVAPQQQNVMPQVQSDMPAPTPLAVSPYQASIAPSTQVQVPLSNLGNVPSPAVAPSVSPSAAAQTAMAQGYGGSFASGGDVGDDSLNPRNWLGYESDSGVGGTFDPMSYAPPSATTLQPRPDSLGPTPLAVAPQGQLRVSPFQGVLGGVPEQQASLPSPSPVSNGRLFNLSDEQRAGLLSAGLGTLASGSHNPFQAIGQGGLQGVAAMDTMRKQKNEQALKQEAQALRQQHADVEARKLAQQAEQFSKTLSENQNQHRLQQEQRERLLNAGKVPPGFRVKDDGAMEAIPGGPHDPEVIAKTAKAKLPGTDEINSDLTGDDFAKTLPTGEVALVKKLANYEIDPKTLSTKGGHREDLLKKVSQYDPAFDQKKYNTIYNAVNKFATGKQGDTVRSFNVGIAHLGTLEGLIGALNNGDVQAFNRISNIVKNQIGVEAPGNFDTARDLVGKEIVKAVVGAGGGVEERREAADKISAAKSPKQLMGVIKTYKELMSGQVKGLQKQYEDSTGLKNFESKLMPETIQQLNLHEKGLSVGDVKKGYRFKGGDPGNSESWEKVK